MSGNEQQRIAVRIGAGAAMAGAVLGTVVNLAHGDLPKDPQEALTKVAQSGQWGLLHLGIMVTALLVLVALLGLSRAATGDAARVLGAGAAAVALPGAALSLTVTAIDGVATKAMADTWAAGDPSTPLSVAATVETVQNALFYAEAAFFFGLPILLIGLVAQLPRAGLPRRTGWLAVAGGGGSIIFGGSGLAGQPLPVCCSTASPQSSPCGHWSPGSSCGDTPHPAPTTHSNPSPPDRHHGSPTRSDALPMPPAPSTEPAAQRREPGDRPSDGRFAGVGDPTGIDNGSRWRGGSSVAGDTVI